MLSIFVSLLAQNTIVIARQFESFELVLGGRVFAHKTKPLNIIEGEVGYSIGHCNPKAKDKLGDAKSLSNDSYAPEFTVIHLKVFAKCIFSPKC